MPAVQASAVARVIGIETIFKNLRAGNVVFLPQRVPVVAQGNTAAAYALTKNQVFTRKEAGDTYGYGSPIERIVAELLPDNGDGVGSIPVTIYPLEDDAGGVVSTGSLDAAGVSQTTAETYVITIGGIPTTSVNVPAGTLPDDALALFKTAIDAVIEMPMITGVVAAGSLPLTSKWKGENANDIVVSIEGVTSGLTFSVVQPVGGATNPDVDDALNIIGDVWESMMVSGFNYDDTATLTKFETFGLGRWGALVRKPLVVFTGTGEATLATLTAATDVRKAAFTNVIVPVPGSVEMPWVIAARAVSRAASVANDNPPQDYAGRPLTGIATGTDAEQYTFAQRDTAVKAGLSTTELVDNIAEMSDTVTTYHPDGEVNPAYRYVVDIVKLQNILFNLSLIFEADDWKGAPLLPDNTPTVNPTAKKPKDAVAAIAVLIDNLALNAIISDPEAAKKTIVAAISSTNPKRLDVSFTVQLSGNTNIISVDFNFGFFFGTLAAA
jgi:phage tail sheath gpL-like